MSYVGCMLAQPCVQGRVLSSSCTQRSASDVRRGLPLCARASFVVGACLYRHAAVGGA